MTKLTVKTEPPLTICLDDDGNIESIFCNERLWNGYRGALSVVDEFRGKIFHSRDAEMIRLKKTPGKTLFEKHWKDCDFSVREIWTAYEDCISWRMKVVLKPGCRERSVQTKQLFPYPYPAYNLHVWSANERFPCPLEPLGGLHLYYGDACYGTVIPAVSIYNEQENLGVTLSKPFDLKSARLAFHFNDYHSEGLEVENTCLYLADGTPAVAEILIHAQPGCWRPGLGWLYGKYPEYFNPPNPSVHELEGGFMITNPYTETAYLKTVGKYKIKWAEVHNHFPVYGDYSPEDEQWDSVIKHDYPDLPVPGTKLSREKINRHIKSLQDNDMKALLYFQCTGDVFIPYAEKCFPDSIARDGAGKRIPTWKECCFVNASAGTFRDHISQQIDKFIAGYPGIDGVFLDQLCYQTLDTAHTDGITAYRNKPAAMFGYSYGKTLNKLAKILHEHGKIIWGNGPFDVEVQKDIDGIMSEGITELPDTYKYLCLAKPLLIHTYPDIPEHVEKMFRHCLLNGASYSIGASSSMPIPVPIAKEVKKIFDTCIPLTEKLFGRKWVFAPAPLKLPELYDGNIFYSDKGNAVMVSLVSKFDHLTDTGGRVDKDIEITISLKSFRKDTQAKVFSCHSRKAVPAVCKLTEHGLAVKIPEHCVMSVIMIQ